MRGSAAMCCARSFFAQMQRVSHSAVSGGGDSRHSGTESAVGRLKAKRSTISMPGAIRNFSTCWAIRRRWFRWANRREGLPIGVQIVGRPWEEEQVLSVAGTLEQQCGAWRIPPMRSKEGNHQRRVYGSADSHPNLEIALPVFSAPSVFKSLIR